MSGPCPGCDVPYRQRKFWPDPEATVHIDRKGREFTMEDKQPLRHYLDDPGDVRLEG